MNEQANQGQPAVDAQASIPAPETQQQTPPPATPAPLPDKFTGKSIEDVVRSYQEVEKFAGEKAREVGELRSQMTYLTNLMQQQLAQQQADVQAPPPPPVQQGPQFNWDKPEDSVRGVARTEVLQGMEALRYQQAAAMAPLVKSSVIREYPQVFDGLDLNAIDTTMQRGIRQRLISPESVANPETWLMAATILRGKMNNWQMNNGPVPVRPVQTEQPAGQRSTQYQGEQVVMDDALAAAVRKWGEAEGKPRDPNQLAREIAEARAKERRY